MDGLATQPGMVRQASELVTDPLADLLAYVSSEGRTSDFVIYDLRALASFTVTPSGGWTSNTMSLIGSPLLKADGVTFNGSTQYGIISDFIGSETITVFARNLISTTSPGSGPRGIFGQYDTFVSRSRYLAYDYATNGGTHLYRTSNGAPAGQEVYKNGINSLPGNDVTIVAQWIDGGGSFLWHDKTSQALSLFAGSPQTSAFDSGLDIIINAISSANLHLPTTTVAIAVIKNALTTTQRETITDFINLL